MASEPSDTEIRAMYATALERIATLDAVVARKTDEITALKAELMHAAREFGALYLERDAITERADRLQAEINEASLALDAHGIPLYYRHGQRVVLLREQATALIAENERRSYQVVGYQNMVKDLTIERDEARTALAMTTTILAETQIDAAKLVPLRRCLTFTCMCGDEFDSVEEFTAHVDQVHTDDAELARIREAK